MKKRLLILLSAVLTVALVALALSLPGMIRRAKNREEMPVFSAETVTISYVFKGTPEKESSLAEQWDCSAVITDEKTIANLGKLLTDAILDREDSD